MKSLWIGLGLFTLSLFFVTSEILAQGSLTPPGPPAPTMKSLQEIYEATTGAGGSRTRITSLPITISSSGSYVLTSNLTGASGQNGITVSASNVTLDLNGFALIGIPGSLVGISSSGSNLKVVNGTVSNWGTGGIMGASRTRLYHLRVLDNTGNGIQSGQGTQIQNCTVASNSGRGVSLTSAQGSSILDCTVQNNGDTGIVANDFTVVRACAVFGNNGGGIRAVTGCLISECTIAENVSFGIQVDTNCRVIGNNVYGSIAATPEGGYGINVVGTANHIEGNTVTNCQGLGISATAGGCFVVKNTAKANVFNINLIGNTNGEIVTATGIITAGPWANFSF